jgi:hypothetical protein
MSIKRRSFITGLLYVSLVFLGPVGFLLLPEQFDVENINAFTSSNLGLLGGWIFVELLIIAVEVVLSYYLYKLLEHYHKGLSFAAFIFRLLVVLVMIVNAIFLTIVLLNSGDNANTLIPLHSMVVYVWQLFFSVHIILLGFIVYRYLISKWRYLGLALMLGSVGYILDSIVNLGNIHSNLLSTLSTIFLLFITIGEIGMAIGLLTNKIGEQNHDDSKRKKSI